MAISDGYKARLRGFERAVNFMYVDSNGHVTIGIGHMLPDANQAVGLPLRRYRVAGEQGPLSALSPGTLRLGDVRPYGELSCRLPTPSLGIHVDYAMPDQIREEFNTIQAKPAAKYFNWYRQFTQCWLADRDIDALFEEDLEKYWRDLVRLFPAVETYPQGAQDALFDLIYNADLQKKDRWPNLKKSVLQRDWKAAANECHRAPPVPQDRNQFTRQCFLDAADEESRRNRRVVDEADYQSLGTRTPTTRPLR